MTRQSIRDLRRTELSQAAFEVLVEYGIRNTTIERVALRAGVSKSVILHHYGDKDALFQAVMRRANTVLRDGVIELLLHAKTPMERLAAVIVGNFADPVFHQAVCHAWINLCADVPYSTESQRIQNVIHSRMRSNLITALQHLPCRYDIDSVAFQISASIDGVWLRASLQSTPLSSREGIDTTAEAVARASGFDKAAVQELWSATKHMETVAKFVLHSRAFMDKVSGGR
jgi:TetR/AcrR family transcriptional repressor of bet genes